MDTENAKLHELLQEERVESAKLRHDLEEANNQAEEVCIENAKLRERVAELEELTDGKRYIPQEWYQLATTENAKLRELVRDMHKALFSLNLDYCQACPREDACVFVHKSFDCDECAFERDMRELGIEVD